MKIVKKAVYISITLTIAGCGSDFGPLSSGVSLEGTGDPTIGSMPPMTTDNLIEISPDEYILESIGRVDQQCSGVKLSMQLMAPLTLVELDIGYGYPVNLGEIEDNRRVGVVISVENETTSTLYNFSESCQPLLELKNNNDEKQSLSFDFECTNQDSVVILKPGENLKYKYVFTLPNGDLERDVVYTHRYSLENIKKFTERDSCEITYPLLLKN
ncbi:hypothetical protein [Acinetobacter towneri]|uniref:hypothetical protein n=1 Tax=Acinetobacter towneri TaxID=202956 RepID=UPI001CE1B0FE|nr:hypothetical protein [Acinetobacter towneri]MCA4791175.1 hypothetical protein [Acinetobacter towneri]